jgi:hypothetical protein
VTEIIEFPLEIESVAEQFSAALLPKLRAAYPLQGRIVQEAPDSILLNIGAVQGVRPGLRLEVFGTEEPMCLGGKLIGYKQLPVGLIEVTSVQDQFAQGKVLEQTVVFEPGWKVREVHRP